MKRQDPSRKLARRRASWLPRLAEPDHVHQAAEALWQIDMDSVGSDADARAKQKHLTREQQDALEVEAYAPALDPLTHRLDTLIPAWIARLLEEVGRASANRERWSAALKAGEDPPDMGVGSTFAVGELTKALQATRERLDPHAGPIIDAIGAIDRDADEHLVAVLEYAGPAVAAAVPKLLALLRERGVWCWPSHLARALANASRYDARVLACVRELLPSEDEHVRNSAISVLGALGPGARAAADQLLAFRGGTEDERCGIIHALSRQAPPAPEFLDVLDAALRDDNGYVRRSAAHALGELTPDSARFVPLLVGACDWSGHLHDTSLPEAAVAALGRYGPRAAAALPRLRRFTDGPIDGRTVRVTVVAEAVERIAGSAGAAGPGAAVPVRGPEVRAAALADDEPLFAVTHEGRQCYIDRAGRLVIQTRFSWGEPFSDGRAVVHDDDGHTFVIDREGREVFESTWDGIRPFSEGLAAVQKDDKWGFVDRDGRVVIEPQHDSVTSFREGLAGFQVGQSKESLGGGGITWTRPGRHGFIDRAGNVAIRAEWHEASGFRDGRALVCTGGTMKPNPILDGRETLQDRKYGYIDPAGRVVIPGEYDLADPFSEGLAVVNVRGKGFWPPCGYIDAGGARVIPLNLTSATSFKDGLALVRRRGRKRRGVQFVIDRTGRTVLELPFRAEPFSEGLAAAWSGDACGFIDTEGRWVVEPQFDQCEPFKRGLSEVQRGDWYGLIDARGSFVWGPTTEGGVDRVLESDWT